MQFLNYSSVHLMYLIFSILRICFARCFHHLCQTSISQAPLVAMSHSLRMVWHRWIPVQRSLFGGFQKKNLVKNLSRHLPSDREIFFEYSKASAERFSPPKQSPTLSAQPSLYLNLKASNAFDLMLFMPRYGYLQCAIILCLLDTIWHIPLSATLQLTA